ncbi:MAG: PAS domain-containing protein, partial [Candidatus Omnitrophica bacterium]|nr:PAS domain-containing protein [Candidatus Omnitrophota bacterium]
MSLVYIFTIAISVIVAFVLIHLARMTGHVEKDSRHNETINRGSTYNHSDDSLNKILDEEIKEFVGSKSKQKAVTEKLSMIMNKQIDERINSTTKELSQKYEKIIDEKAKSEDIAWKTYNKVLNDKRKTESVIRSVAEGVVVVDVNGNVIMLNPAAEKLLATSKKDKVGKSISDNIREEQVVSLFKGGADSDQEIEVVGEGDEAKKIIRSSSAVIENEDGQTVGMVSVLSDITKQRALDRMKSQFIANVTHELRTPLIAIDKSIEILFSEQAGNLSETQEQFLSLAARNLKRLRALIDDLLDLAKLEGG